uniref:Uncharacterized protein n=1 Tax=Dictyoglomus turgidum TaxID=513050 RepID=A0A7C3WLN0_9BACT
MERPFQMGGKFNNKVFILKVIVKKNKNMYIDKELEEKLEQAEAAIKFFKDNLMSSFSLRIVLGNLYTFLEEREKEEVLSTKDKPEENIQSKKVSKNKINNEKKNS